MRGRRGIVDVPWLGDEGGSAAILVMEESEVASMMTAIFLYSHFEILPLRQSCCQWLIAGGKVCVGWILLYANDERVKSCHSKNSVW
jgi:hypothetical protein